MDIRAEQFELDAGLLSLDRELRQEMAVTPPADLAQKVYAATAESLLASAAAHDTDVQFESQLQQAMMVATPPGLADRVYQATAAGLQPGHSRRAVIGRIGWAWRSGVAAAVALGLGAIMWTANQAPQLQYAQPQPEWVVLGHEINRLEQAFAHGADPLEAQMLALSVELDGMALALETERFAGPSDMTIDQLQTELFLLETETQAF